MATLELPSWGYGMRYEYGMFAQSIINGAQVEHPDSWLVDGTPWEFPRPGTHFTVRFGGTVRLQGQDMFALSEDERAAVRAQKMGFVFQSFQLLANLTALENVMLPLEPYYSLKYLVLVLIVVAVGGLGSLRGSLYAGLFLGVIDTLGRYYVPALGAFMIYLAVMAILLVRPQGFVGRSA